MIWSAKQVFDAERLYVRQLVSREQLARASEIMGFVKDRMAHDLINYAHPLGIEMHKGDVQFIEHHEPRFDSVLLTAAWRPETHVGVMLGGPVDGVQFDIPKGRHRWKFTVVVRDTDSPSFAAADSEIMLIELDYQWTGWHETERVWTYECAK